MKLLCLLSFSALLFFSTAGMAQCPFDPTVEGETILCPGGTSVLSTQVYDSYQWYQRPYGDTIAVPIPGATGPTYTVTEADVISYISVEATLNGCTEISPEVLIDGYVFLFHFFIHGG
jgi:hypothetical protein